MNRKYDLKGSTVDREASDKEKEKDLPTLKDNDFVKDGTKVVIGDEAKERLMETLTADVEVTIERFRKYSNLMKLEFIILCHSRGYHWFLLSLDLSLDLDKFFHQFFLNLFYLLNIFIILENYFLEI